MAEGRHTDQFGDRPTGNLLLLPQRFAMAMQDEGWILRMMLPVKIKGRPESVEDRTTHDIERVLVFAKQRRYYGCEIVPRSMQRVYLKGLPRHGRIILGQDRKKEARIAPLPLANHHGAASGPPFFRAPRRPSLFSLMNSGYRTHRELCR